MVVAAEAVQVITVGHQEVQEEAQMDIPMDQVVAHRVVEEAMKARHQYALRPGNATNGGNAIMDGS